MRGTVDVKEEEKDGVMGSDALPKNMANKMFEKLNNLKILHNYLI